MRLTTSELQRLYDPHTVVLYSQQVRMADEIREHRAKEAMRQLPYVPPLKEDHG